MYEKNTPVVNVVFLDNPTIDGDAEAVVIKFARKAQNQKNLEKLQESKREALAIIKSSLRDQSQTLQQRLKERKLQRLRSKQGNAGPNRKSSRKQREEPAEEEFDYVDVDKENSEYSLNIEETPALLGANLQTKGYYQSVLDSNKQPNRIGGLAVESPDISKISNPAHDVVTQNLNVSNLLQNDEIESSPLKFLDLGTT